MSCHLLQRVDPNRNMARFYRLEIRHDLFDQVLLERTWGRLGTHGRTSLVSFVSRLSAEAEAARVLRVKQRRGYRPVG